MSLSDILNILLSGGLIALVIAVATMKATVRKATAEAEKAKADAEAVRITNTGSATKILMDNIVNPLKDELKATREYLQAAKEEMRLLRRAVEAASRCPYIDSGCPVRTELSAGAEGGGLRGCDGAEVTPRQLGFNAGRIDAAACPAEPDACQDPP